MNLKGSDRAMRVAITGASGLIGGHLSAFLSGGGHEVVPLSVREGRLDPGALEGLDGVVHLAGESIVGGRWTRARRERIRESRVRLTDMVSRALAGLERPPGVLIVASGAGYYGDGGDSELDETSPPGQTFLAEVCRQWEEAAEPARQAGIRVVHLRLGVVLSGQGGFLGRLLFPYSLGLGGTMGSGKQWISWIAMEDLMGVMLTALTDQRLQGPVNAVSPRPVTNKEMTHTLADLLHRPTLMPLPAILVKALFGQMGEEIFLQGQRVRPAVLESLGFIFLFPGLKSALAYEVRQGELAVD